MVRGLERRVIFTDASDRADFVARLAAVAEQGALSSPLIYGLASNLADHRIRSVPGGPHAACARENASID